MMIAAGYAPHPLGEIDLAPNNEEFMYWLYLPVKDQFSTSLALPTRLSFVRPLLNKIMSSTDTEDYYLYLTVKRMFVEPGSPGNRPGWHVDGYGSSGDINWVWSDRNPTEFLIRSELCRPWLYPNDDDLQSMHLFDVWARSGQGAISRYPDKTLLRLDESVVHRVEEHKVSVGVRTFVKITMSRHWFCKKGNSHNYLLPTKSCKIQERGLQRNLDH